MMVSTCGIIMTMEIKNIPDLKNDTRMIGEINA
jgi:hypothetical protein